MVHVLQVSDEAWARVEASRRAVNKIVKDSEATGRMNAKAVSRRALTVIYAFAEKIYGVTTGFGKNAPFRIDPAHHQ